MNGREYLAFTKRERTGIITLVIILVMVAILPKYFFPAKEKGPEIAHNDIEKLIADPPERNQYTYYRKYDSTLRAFPSYQKHSYRNNNYKKDFKKEYSYDRRINHNPYQSYEKPVRRKEVIDVNIADTTSFISLPCIGSKLASRIVLFREKLGGFYDVRQIKEVYGITDSVFQLILPQLKCNAANVTKIDINLADKEVLKLHPYIKWNIANALVAYRANHGAFASFEDLAKVNSIDSGALKKLMPYLSFH